MRAERPPWIGLLTGADLRRGAPGGIRAYVLGIARFLTSRDIPVELLTNGPAEEVPASCRVRPVLPEHVRRTVGFQRALRSWATRCDPGPLRVLHLQRPDDIRPLRSWKSRLPAPVVTLHGDTARGIRRRHGAGSAFAYRRIEARVLPSFRAIVAVDPSTADTYRARYPDLAERIRVIPIAVDESRPAAPHAAAPGPLTFLYAGRLSVEKRVDAILDAIADPALSDAKLVVAGSGPEEVRLRRQANGGRVTFHGNVPRERLEVLYREADALVLASEFEGLPTVALEALAAGCPVVAPRGAGLDGLLTPGTGALVDSISDLPRGMASAARLRREGRSIELPEAFTWRSVGPRILAVYEEIAPEAFR